MVSGDQLQQILNDPLQYAVEYRYLLIGAAIALAAVLAVIIGAAGKVRPKPRKRQPVLSPYFPEPAGEPASALPPQTVLKSRSHALPTPDGQDRDYARATLGLADVSPAQGWQLYADGVKANDLYMAMTGLRYRALFITEGGNRSYTSPWWEYKEVAQSYLALARKHNSRRCLELARDAFSACDMTIYPEPSTERVSREVLQNLQLLNHELAVRPGA